MEKIIINAMNLHGGGAVAVATSFISNLSRIYHKNQKYSISVAVSETVDKNLKDMGLETQIFDNYHVSNLNRISAIFSEEIKFLNLFDVVFTVFGPLYTFSLKSNIKHVVGFAQPWIVYPNNEVYSKLSFLSKLILKQKYRLQKWFFRNADVLVVELEHVRCGLNAQPQFSNSDIRVVHSSVDAIYFDKDKWDSVSMPVDAVDLKLGLISRNYLHKNLEVLPEVKRVLKNKYSLDVGFYVTFSDDEFAACNSDFRESVVNVGSLSLSQCPNFYRQLDGVIFPTLLECFSATPIETMVMRKPLFVSERPFIRDCCGDNAIYFDPMSTDDIAEKISNYYNSNDFLKEQYLSLAMSNVKQFSCSLKRAETYLQILTGLNNEK